MGDAVIAGGARLELILGGARSGKSRVAEARAEAWLAAGEGREAVLLATALAGDAEMAGRIERHRRDRVERASRLAVVEVPRALPVELRRLNDPGRLLLVDCLTLWLTQCLLPIQGPGLDFAAWEREEHDLLEALGAAAGPVVLVSNEIGLGVLPMAPEARACVDALGRLHQRVAARAGRVTLMVAGCELSLKDER